MLRLLTLAALLAFAVGIADPVEVVFVPVAGAAPGPSGAPGTALDLDGRRSDESAPDSVPGSAAVAQAALAGAARAGPRAADLELRASRPGVDWPQGPLGARAVAPTAPLPADPEAFTARVLRRPAAGRPTPFEIAYDGPGEVAVTVTLRDATGVVHRQRATMTAAGPFALDWTPPRAGRYALALRARFDGVRIDGGEVVREAQFEVAEPQRVLVFEPSGVAAAALAAQGIPVDLVPDVALDVTRHAAVVIGAALVPAVQEELATAIDAGLGAFVLAPGFGRAGEPLHELLPLLPEPVPEGDGSSPGPDVAVESEPAAPPPGPEEPPPTGEIENPGEVTPEPVEVDKRAIALVLVVDRSGSMGTVVSASGRSRMSYAKTSALQSARALAEGDRVGIVTFGNKGLGRVELPMTDAADQGAIAAGVSKLAHGPEGTFLLSGLRQADRLLEPVTAAVKHVVVVTDGEFHTSETLAMRALAYRMFAERQASVTILSIVSSELSSGFRRDAEEITRDGGGSFYSLPAAESVPVFVSAEVRRSLARAGRSTGDGPGETEVPPAPEKPEPEPESEPEPEPEPEPEREPEREPASRLVVRAVAASPVLTPEPTGAWPTLGSAVATTAPLDAQVLLVAGDDGWPLLCYANRGLGRVGAFAADLAGPAGAEWREETAFPARLALWVQHVMRAEPRGEPRPLALVTTATPPVPTPATLAAFARLAGATPELTSQPVEAPLERRVRSRVPDWAFVALGSVVLLAFWERLAVLRGKHVA